MTHSEQIRVELVQQEDYRFAVHFDEASIPELITDEGPPLGRDAGPSPSRLLAAAVANCLAASLVFAMRKHHNEPGPVRAVALLHHARNPAGRLRIGHIAVELQLGLAAVEIRNGERVLAQFEDFCVVTQSVRAAIPVEVRVVDKAGIVLGLASPS